jgi:dihydroneopterin aldolase
VQGIVRIRIPALPARIGVYLPEKQKPTKVEVLISLTYDFGPAASTDALESVPDYAEIFSLVEEIAGEHVQLLERWVVICAERVLRNFEKVKEVEVRIVKPDPLNLPFVSEASAEVRLARESE